MRQLYMGENKNKLKTFYVEKKNKEIDKKTRKNKL